MFLLVLAVSLSSAAQDRSAAVSDFTKTELHLLRTTTLTDEQFLTGSRDGAPVTIAVQDGYPNAPLPVIDPAAALSWLTQE